MPPSGKTTAPIKPFPWRTLAILAVLALFVAGGLHRLDTYSGDDLSASYIGCRLLASGDANHLYAHDPVDFSAVGPDDAWQTTADETNFDSWLHPYVQTPLWAAALQPLCTRLAFPAFNDLFASLALLSFAAIVLLTARIWAPSLLHPLAIAITLVALWYTTAFQYAMALTQTHVLYLLLTLCAIALAERSRPFAAGTLLALAAAVKLTPAIVLLYWILTRRWRAAAGFVLVSLFLLLTARFTAGPAVFADYLATIHRLSHTLLLSQNNQSLAAVVMGHFYPAAEVGRINILPLPKLLSITGILLTLLCTIAGALLDRAHRDIQPPPAPLGAFITLIAATIFTPIAWTHYYIVLLPALMVLANLILRSRAQHPRQALAVGAAALLIFALNVPPLATDVLNLNIGRYSLLRGQFFSGILCLGTLALVALAQRRYSPTRPTLT